LRLRAFAALRERPFEANLNAKLQRRKAAKVKPNTAFLIKSLTMTHLAGYYRPGPNPGPFCLPQDFLALINSPNNLIQKPKD
jgi:hypothetical protein